MKNIRLENNLLELKRSIRVENTEFGTRTVSMSYQFAPSAL